MLDPDNFPVGVGAEGEWVKWRPEGQPSGGCWGSDFRLNPQALTPRWCSHGAGGSAPQALTPRLAVRNSAQNDIFGRFTSMEEGQSGE